VQSALVVHGEPNVEVPPSPAPELEPLELPELDPLLLPELEPLELPELDPLLLPELEPLELPELEPLLLPELEPLELPEPEPLPPPESGSPLLLPPLVLDEQPGSVAASTLARAMETPRAVRWRDLMRGSMKGVGSAGEGSLQSLERRMVEERRV
jgi:hypothetical protein